MTLTTTKSNGGTYWIAQWTDANGHRHRKGLGNKATVTRHQAELKVARLLIDHAEHPGRAEQGQAPTLTQWCAEYLDLQTDYSEATVDLYRQTIAYLVSWFGLDTRIDQITRKQVAQWRADLSSGGLAENTVAKHVANAKSIFGHRRGACKLDLISANPFDRESSQRRPTHRETFYVDSVALERMLEHCPTPQWRALIGLCRLAGLRRGEALRLEWADVDFDLGQLTVVAPRQDTKHKTRIVPIVPRLFVTLNKAYVYARVGDIYVCQDIHSDNCMPTMRKIRADAGLPQWRDPFQCLRRCCSTDWLDKYGPALESTWMGHSPGVAQAHYHTVTDQVWQEVTGITQPI